MGTTIVHLYEWKAKRSYCEQSCKKCAESWIIPKFTEDRFKEAINRVIAKYWERKSQDDDADSNTMVDDDRHRGNPRTPHDQSLYRICMKLGRPCW